MQAFTIIGMIVIGLVAAAIAWLIWQIVANVFWGIIGAYRLNAIFVRSGYKKSTHWNIIKSGFRNWLGGQRLRADGMGTYIQWGNLQLPIDGRDKIVRRRRSYGA